MNKDYWNGVKIEDIESIGECGGSYLKSGAHEYFTITMKDGSLHTMHYTSKNKERLGENARIEIVTKFNEFNNIPETYLLENKASADINGEIIDFGYRVEDNLGKYKYLTLKEIDDYRKKFMIRDEGWRHLCFIKMLTIKNNKVISPSIIPQEYLDQLEYMGYDISTLEYKT